MLFHNGAYKAVPVGSKMIGDEGNERFAITFKLMEGTDTGKTITFFGGFKGKGSDFTLKAIETCGWNPKTQSDFTAVELKAEVQIVLEDETFTNKAGQPQTETKVKYVNSLHNGPDFTKSATPPAKAKALAARLAEAYLANQAVKTEDEYPAAKVAGKRPAVKTEESDSDDIPF